MHPKKNENENLAQKVHYYLRFSVAFIIIHLALAGRTLRRKKRGDTKLSPWMCYRRLGIKWFNTCGLH